jgi:hypothetical protein
MLLSAVLKIYAASGGLVIKLNSYTSLLVIKHTESYEQPVHLILL